MKVRKLLRDNPQELLLEINDGSGRAPIELHRNDRKLERYIDREIKAWECNGKRYGFPLICITLKGVKPWTIDQ